jgi:hypothetical protein
VENEIADNTEETVLLKGRKNNSAEIGLRERVSKSSDLTLFTTALPIYITASQ